MIFVWALIFLVITVAAALFKHMTEACTSTLIAHLVFYLSSFIFFSIILYLFFNAIALPPPPLAT